MRYICHFVSLFLIASCGSPEVPKAQEVQQNTEALSWEGYYKGELMMPGGAIATQLWIRSDSTYVVLWDLAGKGGVPEGRIAVWKIVNGLFAVDLEGHSYWWQQDGADLRNTDDRGEPRMSAKLERQPTIDAIPRMRVDGVFSLDNSMRFTPCATDLVWPCAGGEQWTDEGEKGGSLHSLELERYYLLNVEKRGDPWTICAEVSIATGPAMEGDEEDEYIFIHRVVKDEVACP